MKQGSKLKISWRLDVRQSRHIVKKTNASQLAFESEKRRILYLVQTSHPGRPSPQVFERMGGGQQLLGEMLRHA